GIATSYELKIPKDSLVGLATAGVLGETYLEIDTAHASRPPLEAYGYLKSKRTPPLPSAEDYLKAFASALDRVGSPHQEKEGKVTNIPPSPGTYRTRVHTKLPPRHFP